MFTESLLAAALTFSPWHGDLESPEERLTRLTTISEAINDAALLATCSGAAQKEPAQTEKGASEAEESAPPSPCTPLWRGGPGELAYLLLTQAYFETRLAQHVHEGRCRSQIGECDSGRAIGLWQLQAGAHLPVEIWQTLAGTSKEATTRAALEATRALGRGRNYCGTLSGAVSLYATGRTCHWKPARARISFLERLLLRAPRA